MGPLNQSLRSKVCAELPLSTLASLPSGSWGTGCGFPRFHLTVASIWRCIVRVDCFAWDEDNCRQPLSIV